MRSPPIRQVNGFRKNLPPGSASASFGRIRPRLAAWAVRPSKRALRRTAISFGVKRYRARLTTLPKQRADKHHMQVFVRDNNVDQALKVLKKKMQREGIFREM